MTALDRRTLLRSGLVATPLAAALAVPEQAADARPRRGRTLAKNLRVPWGIAFLPNGNALVSERPTGDVYRVTPAGHRHRVGTVPGVANIGEGGLLGLAVATTFHRDHWLYAYLTTRSDNRIVRMRYVDGALGRPHVLLAGIPTNTNHHGGRLVFGPGGLLFASAGDARDGELAQDRSSLAGKILRLTPDGDVPDGNPFGNYVYSYGHRNVEGLCFDGDGRLWATELGENTRDELNHIVKGGNYGWPRVEGGDGPGGYRDPFVTWHPTSTCSPSGIAVAHGRAYIGALAGRCLYVVRLRGPHRKHISRYRLGGLGRIRTVQQSPTGALWITTSNRDGRGDPAATDDRVIRLRL